MGKVLASKIKEKLKAEQLSTIQEFREVIRQEGVYVFIRRVVRFFLQPIIFYTSYDILDSCPSALPKFPTPKGFSFKTIQSEDIVEFQILVGKKVVSQMLVALNEDAKRAVAPLPFKVDFKNGQVIYDGAWTLPEYRRQGLYSYILYTICRTYPSVRCIIEKGSTSLQKIHKGLGAVKVGDGQCLKILGLTFSRVKYNTNKTI